MVELIDTGFGRPQRAACYLVRGRDGAALIDAGTPRTAPRVLRALDAAGVARDDITALIVTHVHLDHAGGAGVLLAALPRARLVAHPRGARHLIDPTRLIAGAEAVYGRAELLRIFGEVIPAASARVTSAPDGFVVELGERTLRLYDAPGHARHHLVIYDEATRGIFAGDTFGVSYREWDSDAGPAVFPSTSPVQFDPLAMHASIDRMIALRPERIYLTHYGMISGDLMAAARELHRAIDELLAIAKEHGEDGASLREGVARVLLASLERQGVDAPARELLEFFENDIELDLQGLSVWVRAMGR